MKSFFSSFFGAMVGVIIAMVLCTVIFIAGVSGIFSSAFKDAQEKHVSIKDNSVMMIKLNGPVRERGVKNPFENFDFSGFNGDMGIGLDEIKQCLETAKEDDKIKGIYLNLESIECGIATLEEIRNALIDFKKSGKFIYSYSELYGQKAYYLSTVADKIILNPQGDMEFKGLSAQIMFYKKALENLNVEMQIFRHGKFKSAIEPYMLEKMSEANRLQTETFLNSLWNHMVQGIAKTRKMEVSELQSIADDMKIGDPSDAKNLGLVDELLYEDEVMSMIRKKISIGEKEKINFVKLADYKKKAAREDKKDGKNAEGKIAVIYAVGSIESGQGDENTIGSERIAKAIRDARNDSSIKAIVLRVNSPGGSALASDVMWREVSLAKKSKPFVVSMGDVAASGGYYISCAADKIFAQPNTITGSIGVFGMMPNINGLLTQKLGINIDTVNTNKHSDIGTMYRAVSEQERAHVQKGVENIYDVFIGRVADGRGMSKSEVDSIGQGRVWSGADAIKIKLVDELGGIDDALAYAAKKAKLDHYKIESMPKQKDPFENFFKEISEETEERIMHNQLGQHYQYIKHIKNLIKMKGVQARMPFEFIIY